MRPPFGPVATHAPMKKTTRYRHCAILSFLVLSQVKSAVLTEGETIEVTRNHSDFNLSVFPGKAGYNDNGLDGTPDSGTFGDGTVLDYRFFNSPGDALNSYADGGAGVISNSAANADNVNGGGEHWAVVWTTNDPGTNYSGTANFPAPTLTFARAQNISGTIDISGLVSGQLYFPHGTFINQWEISLTMTGAGQPTLFASADAGGVNGPSVNIGWITDFSFSDAAAYDTITYTYTNADVDGSRARFMGVILDGSSSPTTPPTVTNLPVTDIATSSATLRGEVTDTGGANPNVTIYWGDNDAGTSAGSWDNSINLGAEGGEFSTGLTGLSPSTTYYFRAFASNGAGLDWANSTSSFTTANPANPATIVNSPATNIGFVEADLNGSVTSTGGEPPIVTIYYGDNDGGTTPGNWDEGVDIGEQSGSFTTDLFGLNSNTTYYFRAVARNSGGESWAPSTNTFRTDAFSAPTVSISPADSVTGTAAKLRGSVSSTGGDPPDILIYWGNNDAGTNPLAWDNSIELGSQSGGFSTVVTGLSPLTTYYFRILASNDGGFAWSETSERFTTSDVSELIINEFMASNDGGATNNTNNWYPITNQVPGTTHDWIEILNTGSSTLDLEGWHLTDDPSAPEKWTFPASTNLPAGGFLIVYASGTGVPDANDNLHTNFRLSSGGEYLALVRPSGSVASEFGPSGTDYPGQDEDISYGLDPAIGSSVYFSSPTPGSANDNSGIARVRDTNFNPDRGYYDQAVNVTITSATPDATIYYTTDGTRPVDQSGNPTANASVYSGPIPITKTTTLKASATKTGLAPTNIDCQTYILLDIDNAGPDGTDPAGFNAAFLEQTQPSGWGNLSSGDYNMDTRVSKSTSLATDYQDTTAQTMLKGLRDIPTISIAMNRADFSGTSGIYTNSTDGSLEYECSAEYIPAAIDTRNDWQINCGIKVQGGASRSPSASPKHSMNFRFRNQYGAGRLREELFPDSEVEEFNSITLRAGYNNSWIHRDAGQRGRGSMIRDQWMRESMLDMGNPAAGHGFMVHVFVNGLYWGVHNLCERPEASHYAAYNGGNDDFLDARNGASVVDGTATAWEAIPGVVAGGNWEQIQQVIDIDQYIDYQIINRYGGNSDLKSGGNWRAAGGGPFTPGQPGEMAPWQLYSWDGERTLESPSLNNSPLDPMGVRSQLETLPEYRIRFADRLEKHFGPGGALTPAATAARWMKFANDLDRAIIAESARWGDHRGTLYTRDDQWLSEQNRLMNTYFPARSSIVESNYGSLLPSVAAPDFLVNDSPQSEGVIPVGGNLKITSTTGTIYYTTDGSDPRLAGGGINPSASSIGGGSNQTAFIQLEESGWKYLDTGVAQSDSDIVLGNPAYNSSDWKHPSFNDAGWGTGQALLGYGGINGRDTNTSLNLQTPRLPTIYFRKSFTVSNASNFTQLNLGLVRDDGAIVYLNGREIGRSNMNGGNQKYGDFAISSTSNEGGLVNLGIITLGAGDLLEGTNVLAVEVHQNSSSSSDTGLDVQLTGIAPASGGGGNVVPLTRGAVVRARAFDNGEWSALSEGGFLIAPIADASNIAISEIMYNPAGSSEDGEWIELVNISAATIDLSNLTFEGIEYTFPVGFTLAPDARVVVVKNQAAFAALYNTAGLNIAPGDFSTSSLSNSGEQIALIDALGIDARRFTYNDRVPWPTSPDGDGYSIVLISPETNPDHAVPTNWRTSALYGGSPGATDSTTFEGDPSADSDGDGLNALLEYALGSTLGDAGFSPESFPSPGTNFFDDGSGTFDEYLTLTHRRNLAADDLIFEAQVGSDLSGWNPLGTTAVSATANGDGTETVIWRSLTPMKNLEREFIRLKVQQKP